MKSVRQSKIIELVQNENIETQEDLAARLKDFNIDATQATISRDIKELRLHKSLTENGNYKYSLPGYPYDQELDIRLRNIFKESVLTVEQAGNIVVIKTLPGLASAACSAVDAMHYDYIVGSLAGDDTGFIVIRDDENAANFAVKLKNL